MSPRARSVRTEIVAGFALLIASFGGVAGYSLVQQQRAVASLRLANEAYLRLTLRIGEAHNTQAQVDAFLERLLDEPDRANVRTWLAAARRTRRVVIQAGASTARAAQPRDLEDRALLRAAAADLDGVDAIWVRDEGLFDELFQALATGERARALDLQRRLYAREVGTEATLASLARAFQRRVRALSDQAERQQTRSLELTLLAVAVACALGLGTTLNARRALQPLAALRDRARAVARGNLAPAPVVARPDEIGELAGEFERMVHAVAARDADLRAANLEIQQAEQHLEQLVASLRSGVMVVHPDGTVATANPSAERLHAERDTRTSNHEHLVGVPYRETLFGRDERLLKAVRAVSQEGAPQAFENIPLGQRTFDVVVVPFVERGEREDRRGALVVADDVTLREQARQRLLQAERLAAIGRMAAHVTHEVRNPLSSMGLNAEMLSDEVQALGDEAREASRLVRAIQREIDRLTHITEEYLRVARLPRPRLEREDLGALVSEAVRFVTPELERSGVEVSLQVPAAAGSVMVDEAQLRQALLNLLRNGREALEGARSVPRRLVVRVGARDRGLEVSVADNGPGIAPEAREHLFELFFTTKDRGTGLGLPLTREIVVAHGGTLRAEDAPPEDGGGARFVLWLPAAEEAPCDRTDEAPTLLDP
ncbi:MAG: HAMP domain-containing protein [Deltaproteobacteria bacterium]|nr:HAMP domain-containing protein [Deltaproteobacteria bacterium]